jgi:hypothetical protein
VRIKKSFVRFVTSLMVTLFVSSWCQRHNTFFFVAGGGAK